MAMVLLFYRLHNFLLQPRGSQQMERGTTKNVEQAYPVKVKKVIGKIRVEGMGLILNKPYSETTLIKTTSVRHDYIIFIYYYIFSERRIFVMHLKFQSYSSCFRKQKQCLN